jgi:hypothetical protein
MGRGRAAAARRQGVADELKKGARITGNDRARLAGELKKKYASGSSIRALAEETNRSYGFVHRMLTESGVQLRGRGGATRGSKRVG